MPADLYAIALSAKAVGVDNRLNPAESIRGGAAYLAQMRASIDSDVPARDRTLLALAAHNIGLAHLRDAQRLARRLGKNPQACADLKTVFPLLANKRYYRSLKYGYARGTEPVRYIAQIRDYEDVIARIPAECRGRSDRSAYRGRAGTVRTRSADRRQFLAAAPCRNVRIRAATSCGFSS